MRKYEAAALLPDLSISFKSHVAPATPLFEEATTAFARGTLVPTVRGLVAVEDLLPGDYLESSEGAQPVTWIGSTTYVPGIEDDATTLAYLARITSDAFGPGRPLGDVLVGPAARMVLQRGRLKSLIGQDRVLVPVSDFADGDRIVRVTPGGAVQLYHLMLGRHGTIRVGGIEMETYHPGKAITQPMGDALRALFLSMFPNIDVVQDFGELTMTRTTREVIDSLTAM
ncbi:Hint domain-containing protein [Salipiger sp. P9]|uniref:Hint domain-containing protein n=1 Tax=Salipiger pentaromativorans TaxID=2943193 RepID=UPI0021577598|nr:Hint domain-containing protein [Salipiger pentaromativorans]MCR8550918.1 Hint domain-containing protein [Salipiger pentaromativorans]